MEQKLMKKVLQVAGMTCASCEMRIENRLKKIEGVVDAKAIYSSSNVYVTYDANVVGLDEIADAVEKLDYRVKNGPQSQAAVQSQEVKKTSGDKGDKMNVTHLIAIGIIIFAVYIIINNTIGFNFIPQVNQNMGYGILFVVGLITSLHCIAMCGGINLSQCVSYKYDESDSNKLSKLKPSLMYNAGRVISYTIIGGIVGALGSVISFSGMAKGIVAVISGVFMVIMGLNMLNIFPWLRKLNPRMPRIFGNRIYNNNGKHGPFYIGILNGLMPCGPLQAMQIYALGTGSFLAGAGSMLVFSLGTVPLMFGFGAVSSFLNGKFTHRMMKVSAVLVMILGIIMLNRGLSLSGINLSYGAYASSSSAANVAKIDGAVQVVTTKLESGRYTPFTVQKGIPVKWTVQATASDINGCNGEILVPKYGISKKLAPGDNLIEFTPEEEGNIPYTCWMGMIGSNIKVVPDLTQVSVSDIAQADNSAGSTSTSSGCCGPTPAQFADGKIPTDNIQVAKVENGQQTVTVTVNNNGFTPAAFVVQKGVETKVVFDTEQLSGCDAVVVFPEYQGQLDLSRQKETPWLTVEQDFTFQCSMNMLHGYIKAVDDINNINLDDIKQEIQNYKPAPAQSGSASCCAPQSN